ncbi:hypothetical protein DFJ74DRAFT_27640 [Hyaloraphidium curvatum]|nr:hypothetical protein DFJ74DRAFT_27640 [Hyaloraphidium curvatum]
MEVQCGRRRRIAKEGKALQSHHILCRPRLCAGLGDPRDNRWPGSACPTVAVPHAGRPKSTATAEERSQIAAAATGPRQLGERTPSSATRSTARASWITRRPGRCQLFQFRYQVYCKWVDVLFSPELRSEARWERRRPVTRVWPSRACRRDVRPRSRPSQDHPGCGCPPRRAGNGSRARLRASRGRRSPARSGSPSGSGGQSSGTRGAPPSSTRHGDAGSGPLAGRGTAIRESWAARRAQLRAGVGAPAGPAPRFSDCAFSWSRPLGSAAPWHAAIGCRTMRFASPAPPQPAPASLGSMPSDPDETERAVHNLIKADLGEVLLGS